MSSCPSLLALLFFNKCVLRTFNLAHQGWVTRELNLVPAGSMQAQGWGDGPAGRHVRCGKGGARIFPELCCKTGSELASSGQSESATLAWDPGTPFPVLTTARLLTHTPEVTLVLMDLPTTPHPGGLGSAGPASQAWWPHLLSCCWLVRREPGDAQSATLLTAGSSTRGKQGCYSLCCPLGSEPRKGGGEPRERRSESLTWSKSWCWARYPTSFG